MGKTKVTMNLDEQLVKKAKHKAIDNQTTFSKLVSEALKAYI